MIENNKLEYAGHFKKALGFDWFVDDSLPGNFIAVMPEVTTHTVTCTIQHSDRICLKSKTYAWIKCEPIGSEI